MKKWLSMIMAVMALGLSSCATGADNQNNSETVHNTEIADAVENTESSRMEEFKMKQEIMETKMELKELVDTFSILADEKDVKTQAQLFTEDATLTSYVGGEKVSEQHGRKEIEEACAAFLALFDTVYHMNGQQVVNIDGDKASGKAYCQVTLIGKNDEGKRIQNIQGVWYEDEYVKQDGKWLIANRTSHFTWSDEKEV